MKNYWREKDLNMEQDEEILLVDTIAVFLNLQRWS